jgi:NitT/TauT family transport system substrate-binding protein
VTAVRALSKSIQRRALVAIFALVFAAAALAGASATAANKGAALTSVNIALFPFDATSLPFYAKEKGFFRQEGLDAKITTIGDPAQGAAAILSGSAQFASASIGGLAILKSRHAPLRLAAAGALYRSGSATTWLLAGKGQHIRGARDLVGKVVGIDGLNSIAHLGLKHWLKKKGVSPSSVTFQPAPFAQTLGPLSRGTIQAAVLPEPFVTLARRGGAKGVAKIYSSVCKRTCLYTGWMVRTDFDPAIAARFRRAIEAAAVWADKKSNRAASGRILVKYTPIDHNILKKMNRVYFATGLNALRSGQPWIDLDAEFGLIPASFPIGDLTK